MIKLNPIYKILLSLGLSTSMGYFLTVLYPSDFHALNPDENSDLLFRGVVGIALAITYIILIKRIIRFKNMDVGPKQMWIFLIVFFPFIAGVLYLWFFDDKLVVKG